MAQPSKKRTVRKLKKTETVRERSERTVNPVAKKRHVKRTALLFGRPFVVVGKFISKVLSPLAFLLKPFWTRPARKIGRIFASIFLLRFFRDAWKELRQVQWPTARETIRLTTAVFIFSVLFGVVVAIVDFGLDKVFRKLFID